MNSEANELNYSLGGFAQRRGRSTKPHEEGWGLNPKGCFACVKAALAPPARVRISWYIVSLHLSPDNNPTRLLAWSKTCYFTLLIRSDYHYQNATVIQHLMDVAGRLMQHV